MPKPPSFVPDPDQDILNLIVRQHAPRTNKARWTSPWEETRLKCAIGHEYSGRTRKVRWNGHDMDGDEFWHDAVNYYDPSTCIVCGLRTECRKTV